MFQVITLSTAGSARLAGPSQLVVESVHVLRLELCPEHLAEVVQRGPALDDVSPLASLAHERDLVVELVVYLPDDLLEDILDRDQARGAADVFPAKTGLLSANWRSTTTFIRMPFMTMQNSRSIWMMTIPCCPTTAGMPTPVGTIS